MWVPGVQHIGYDVSEQTERLAEGAGLNHCSCSLSLELQGLNTAIRLSPGIYVRNVIYVIYVTTLKVAGRDLPRFRKEICGSCRRGVQLPGKAHSSSRPISFTTDLLTSVTKDQEILQARAFYSTDS